MGPVFQKDSMQNRLHAKFPLISVVLYNENFNGTALWYSITRLERASLYPGKRRDEEGRPALAQDTASPT